MTKKLKYNATADYKLNIKKYIFKLGYINIIYRNVKIYIDNSIYNS